MPTVQKAITVQAPAQRIFELLADPNRLPDFAPGVTEVKDIQQTSSHVGDSVKVTYSVLSLKFPMKFTTKAYNEPYSMAMEMDGNMQGTWNWKLDQRDGATNLSVSIDYKMKMGLLGKAMNAILVERMNEKNTEQMLENLKNLSEKG